MAILYKKAGLRGNKIPPSWWGSSNDFPGKTNLGDELTPLTPLIDVVNDFSWTLTPTNSEARKEAPYIFLREFYQLDTYLNQALKPYGKKITGGFIPTNSSLVNPAQQNDSFSWLNSLDGISAISDVLTPVDAETDLLYEGLFDHLNFTDFYYKLPFFTSEYFDVQNKWEGNDVLEQMINFQTDIGSFGKAALEAKFGDSAKGIGGFLQNLPRNLKRIERFNIELGNPAVGLMDPPHVWKGATNRTYTFEFPLYNISHIGQTKPETTIMKNWELCFLLTYQNLVNKRNYYTAIPPVYYEVTIPGIHYCKASYMSDITINNIGNIRLMKLPLNGGQLCDVNIPDAYSIQITLTDLLQPSKNLLRAATRLQLRERISNVNSDQPQDLQGGRNPIAFTQFGLRAARQSAGFD